MTISALRRVCLPFLVVAVAIGLLALSSGDSQAQWVPNTPQFQPIFDIKACNDLPATHTPPGVYDELKGGGGTCVPDTSPSNHADTTTLFTVPAGHMNYAQDVYISWSAGGETRLDAAAMGGPNAGGTGAPAGGLKSTTTLGLTANPCNSTTYPSFVWFESEASLAPADEIACQPEGTSNRWDPLKYDDDGLFAGVADSDSPIVTKFPSCTKKVFDPDGDGIDTDGNPATIGDQPVQPRARFAGLTKVSTEFQMLQNIEFNAVDLRDAYLANPGTTHHPYAKIPPFGYVNLTVLNDPMTVTSQPNPISDFCTILGTQGMLKGQIDTDNNGTLDLNRVTSSATPGSYHVESRTMSYRDADGDGIENNFDTCAFTANTAAENPYNSSGPDTDMLDTVCDPFPAVKDDDEDGDGYINSQDICPLHGNPIVGDPPTGGETDAENTVLYNTGAPDGGPRQDSIGDDCDPNTTVSNGLYMNAWHLDSNCIVGGAVVDGDGDGWCLAEDPNDGNAAMPGQMASTPMDSAGIKYSADLDSDLDGYTNLDEWYMGVDPSNDCPAFSSHDAWPSDMDNSGTANLLDLLVFKPAFNCAAGTGCYSVRVDLDANDTVNLLDLLPFKPDFNVTCTFP